MSPPTTQRTGPPQESRPASTQDSMLMPTAEEYRQRLHEQAEAARRKRELTKQIREQFKVARDPGLSARHAAKLRRRCGRGG